VRYAYDLDRHLTGVSYADTHGSGFNYSYEDPYDRHNLTEKRDKSNHVLNQWAYDGQDRCVSNFDPRGRGVAIEYVSDTLLRATDVYGEIRSYTITPSAGRKRVRAMTGKALASYAASNARRWDYDNELHLIEIEYGGGTINRLANFDERGNPQTVTLAAGSAEERTIAYTYHPDMHVPLTRTEQSVLGTGNQVKVTIWDYDDPSPGDNPALFNQNPTGLPFRVIQRGFTKDPYGSIVAYEYTTALSYNAKGQVLAVDGPLPGPADTTEYGYTAAFDLATITRPLIGLARLAQHDAAGFPGELTDVNGQVQRFTYDGRGRLTEVFYPADGSTRSTLYNQAGLVESTLDEDQVSAEYIYEPAYGRLAQTLDHQGNHIDYGYDTQGKLTSMIYRDPQNSQTRVKQWSYEHPTYPGLLWKEIQANGSFTEYAYDDAENISAVTDPDLDITAYGYDALHRLRTVTEPGAVQTLYAYNRHGKLASVTDGKNHHTDYTYDDMGRLVESVSPDAGATRYLYDAAGNLLSKTDARGVRVDYDYDDLNRPTSVSFPAHDGHPAYGIDYAYDQELYGRGRLTEIVDPSGRTALHYNARGRLTQKNVTLLIFFRGSSRGAGECRT
jgi:YD repeat-containing protein